MTGPQKIASIALLLLLVLGCAAPVADTLDLEGGHRFGLFIGIDDYPRMPGLNLDGCVNDAEDMHKLFTEQFGVENSCLLRDEQATRSGIQRGFLRLVRAVERAKSAGKKKISVVITYAGHGYHVMDESGDEKDGKDESWVTTDSTFKKGENDVRDDEIERVLSKLASLGAQVLFISDSCHSGTVFRGETFGKARTLPPTKEPRSGPSESMFPKFDPPDRDEAGDPVIPGLVSYTACTDFQEAQECYEEGHSCGRLSYMIRRVLCNLPRTASYRYVFEEVVKGFDRKWQERDQSPQFHADYGKSGELFLEAGYPPMHASVQSIQGGEAVLSMGAFHGVAKGASFKFYSSLKELESLGKVLAVGEVVKVFPTECRVQVSGAERVAGMKARLDAVRVVDFTVRAGPGVPDSVQKKLDEMAAAKQITLTTGSAPYQLAVHGVADPPAIRFYLPDVISDGKAGSDALPLKEICGNNEKTADDVASWILYRARVQRILSLECGATSIESKLVDKGFPPPKDAAQELKDQFEARVLEEQFVDGIRRLRSGTGFSINVRNNSTEDLYFYVLGFESHPDGGIKRPPPELLYPLPGFDQHKEVSPREEREIAIWMAEPSDAIVEEAKKRQVAMPVVRKHLKILASSESIELGPLLLEPKVGIRVESERSRGAEDEVDALDILVDLFHGVRTRGGSNDATWATNTLIFDVTIDS